MADQPTHVVKCRTGRKNDRGDDILWPYGVAWKHRNGDGYNVQMNGLPVGFDGFLLIVEKRDE